jgi:hypothetical protein
LFTRRGDMNEFTGGMEVRTKLGRMWSSIPLARLILGNGEVILKLRGPLTVLIRPRRVAYIDIEYAQPYRAFLIRGVRFRLKDERIWYFWTLRPAAVFAAIRANGIPVKDEVARYPWFDFSEK